MKKCRGIFVKGLVVFSVILFVSFWGVDLFTDLLWAQESRLLNLEKEGSWDALDHSESIKRTLEGLEDGESDEQPARDDVFKYTARSTKNNQVIDVLEVQNMEIREVLELIALKSGLEIIGAEQFEGKVSIFLNNVDAKDALRIILDTNGLAYREVHGTRKNQDPSLLIMTTQEYESRYGISFASEVQTKILTLNHAKIEDVLPLVEQVKSREGKIMFDEPTNTLIMMDSPADLQLILDVIRELDVDVQTKKISLKHLPKEETVEKIRAVLTKNVGHLEYQDASEEIIVTDTPLKLAELEKFIQEASRQGEEIIISAKVIQITLNDEYQEGVDWEAIVTNFQSVKFQGREDDQGIQGDLSVGTVSEEDYEILLDALDTVGAINSVLNIKIETVNNQGRSLDVNSLELMDREKADEESKDILQTKEAEIFVVPSIKEEDYLSIHFQVAKEFKDQKGEGGDSANAQEKDSPPVEIEMKNGSTIVVGGFMREVSVEFLRKIPILGDLPLLGFVFRNQRQRERQAEIVVFVTIKTVPKQSLGLESF